mmetsp:Transcript_26803/g.65169  ORF Transcript_26803/g.65169 Transcript_26803/m.65169 type:complete len:94 (+) Transcript_26803:398-679(+)
MSPGTVLKEIISNLSLIGKPCSSTMLNQEARQVVVSTSPHQKSKVPSRKQLPVKELSMRLGRWLPKHTIVVESLGSMKMNHRITFSAHAREFM